LVVTAGLDQALEVGQQSNMRPSCFSWKTQRQRLVLELALGASARLLPSASGQREQPPPLMQAASHRWGNHSLKLLLRAARRGSWKYSGKMLSLWVLGSH